MYLRKKRLLFLVSHILLDPEFQIFVGASNMGGHGRRKFIEVLELKGPGGDLKTIFLKGT